MIEPFQSATEQVLNPYVAKWVEDGRRVDILPAFHHYLGAPYKVAPHAVEWYMKELKKLIEHLETHFGVSITEEKLKKATEAYNISRQLLAELDAFRIAENATLSGTDMYTVVLAGTLMPREIYNDHLTRLLAEIKKNRAASLSGRKRIMVTGSIVDDAELISLIEDAGALVVAENLCFGIRGLGDRVSLEGDPLAALVERYMQENTCPRFIMSYDERVKFLHDKARRAAAQGVVLQNVRFCEYHGSENSLLERSFEKIGIPAVRLEREHGPLNETGRVRLRLDALLNRISRQSTTVE